MFLRNLSATLLGCALLVAPIAATAADRGLSTPEERKQALSYIQDFEANPLGPNALHERQWVIEWVIEVPDVHVRYCSSILDKMNKSDKKDGPALLAAIFMAQTEFALQDATMHGDVLAQYQAGVEGALRVYEPVQKLSHPFQQRMSEADPNHGFRRGRFEFVVFAQPSRPSHPSEASLDDPAFGQYFEQVQLISLDHLDIVAEHFLGPVDQRARVAAISKDLGNRIETTEQPHQHSACADAVLNPGRMHDRS